MCSGLLLGCLFSVLIFIGIFELTAVPLWIFPTILKSQAIIRQNSDGSFPILAKYWAKIPAVERYRFYMFNVTNPQKVLRDGAPVEVEELGPYTYLMTEQKNVTEFLGSGKMVKYRNNKTWVFSPEESCPACSENDEIFHPNLPYMAVVAMPDQQHINPIIVNVLNAFITFLGEKPFKKFKVAELLFASYDDPLINLIHSPIFHTISDMLGEPIKFPEIPNIGYFPKYNNTDDGEYVIETGKGDIESFGHIVSWNNWTELPWWNDTNSRDLSHCGDGTFQKPMFQRNDEFKMYQSLACRTFNLRYDKDSSIRSIKTYQFLIEEDSYDTTVEKNKGYRYENKEQLNYFPEYSNSSDLPPGMIPLRCLPSLPLTAPLPGFLSPPHFAYSPSEISHSPHLKGLSPDLEKHNIGMFHVEPNSGATLYALLRIQLSFTLRPSKHFPALAKTKPVMVPVFWLEVEVSLNDDTLSFVWFSVTFLKLIIFWSGIALLVIGVVGLVATLVYTREAKKRSPLKGIRKMDL